VSTYYLMSIFASTVAGETALTAPAKAQVGDVIVSAIVQAPGTSGDPAGADVTQYFVGTVQPAIIQNVSNITGPAMAWILQNSGPTNLGSALILFLMSRG
jgi:hypothetical protein